MPPEPKRHEPGFKTVVSLAVVVGLMLALGSLYFDVQHVARWQRVGISLAERLGDAFLIAAVLAIFVERTTAPEHVSRLLVEMFGRRLPRELIDHIQDYFKWDFVRTEWKIWYEIRHVDGSSDGDMTLLATSSYNIENRTSEVRRYDYRYSVELGHGQKTDTQILAVTTMDKEWTRAEITENQKRKHDYLVVRKDGDDALPLKPASVYRFGAKSIQGFRNEKVSPYWALYPVVGTTFTIYYPVDFTVEFDATFEDESPQPKELPDKAAEHLNGRQWTIGTPILPGQGFLVRCSKNPPASR
jgi:hypothetical protein